MKESERQDGQRVQKPQNLSTTANIFFSFFILFNLPFIVIINFFSLFSLLFNKNVYFNGYMCVCVSVTQYILEKMAPWWSLHPGSLKNIGFQSI